MFLKNAQSLSAKNTKGGRPFWEIDLEFLSNFYCHFGRKKLRLHIY